MRKRPLCLALGVGLLAPGFSGCATPAASDLTRNGQPVVETTIGAVINNPDEWDGKWVRISGTISHWRIYSEANAALRRNEKPNLVSSETSIGLEPERHNPKAAHDGDRLATQIVASGRVHLSCWRLWKEMRREIGPWVRSSVDSAGHDIDVSAQVDFHATGKLAYCNHSDFGPHLDDVLIQPLSGQAQ